MNNEILNLKICNRILEADGPIFSGESVNIRLAIDAGDSVAAKHKLVLFGFDKSALAESAAFSATENQGVWESSINTATNEFAAYFRTVPANASKSVGCMVVNTETGDTITRGNIAVISTPFPSELTPVPKPFEFVSEAEMQAAISACESSLSAEFESGLSSLSSDVADLSDGMRSLAESLRDLDTLKADAETVENLAEASERKREVFEAETIAEKVNLASSDLASNWYYLTSDNRRDSCLMRIYFDDADIETGTTSTIRQFFITFPHLPNREEIQYSNDGPNGYYENIFGLVSEYNTNFQPPSAEGWYSYRFSFCPAYDLYFAELLAYRPI